MTRRPNRSGSCVFGIDIGGTEIKGGLIDRHGRIHARASVSSSAENVKFFEQSFKALVAQLQDKLRAQRAVGVGIGCKGIAEPESCRVRILPGPFSFLEGVRLDQWVHQALGFRTPVSMDNDAKAALVGENRWGAAQGKKNVVLLTLGSGVGGAILADGKIVRGSAEIAGHLGHVTVDYEGPICSCGNRGCLEAIFSARAIEGEALGAIRRGCDTLLRPTFSERSEALTCHDVFSAARAGDAVAGAIIRRAVAALAGAMAGMAHALDPELFILGGRIAGAGQMLFAPLRQDFFERTRGLARRRIPIRKAALGEAAGLIGAAAMAWNVVETV